MTFIVSCHGKNFNQNPPPMSTIKALITNILALAKLQGVINESECRLLFNDRELDKEAKIRFANLPSNAKLILKTGYETVMGHRTHDDVLGSMNEGPHGAQASQVAATKGGNAVPTAAVDTEPPEHSSSSPISEKVPDCQKDQDNMDSSPSNHIEDHQSIEDQVYIFNEAEMATAVEQLGGEIDYNVNESDIMMLHSSLSKKTKPSILKTQKMRDDEMQKKLQNLRAATIKIEFPHGILIQFCVPGNSTVGNIYQRLQSILQPEIFADLYLYTVPPKTNLLQMNRSILAAGLLPAARLKVGFRTSKDFKNPLDIIKSEFSSRIGLKPPKREATQDYKFPNDSSKGSATRVQKDTGQSNKMPKWLKLGHK